MATQELQAQCVKNVVVETRDTDGQISRTELSSALALKKEVGNARLVSDDAMLWVAHGSIHSQPSSDQTQQHVTVRNGKRSFSFYLASNPDSDAFLSELRAQVAGQSGLDAKRKKRKIRKQMEESQSAGFVPVVNSLASPSKPTPPPLTPNRRRLSDSTNSPRLAPPLPMSLSTVSEAHGVYPSPSKSPFRSPFRKKPTPPPARLASPIVSLALPPKSPALLASTTPSPAVSSASSARSRSQSQSQSQSPREWLSPARRMPHTPPSVRRHSLTPGSRNSTLSSSGDNKENTPARSSGGIVNKRVRSLQRMLDDVPREEPDHTAGAAQRPPIVRSPFFLSPPNAREMSPVRRPSPAKKLRSPARPLGELQLNTTPPRPLKSNGTPPSNPQAGTASAGELGLRKVTHGLLNLGNFCYMNAIVQSLAALPGFADHLQKDEWLVAIMKKRLAASGTARDTQEIAELFKQWKGADQAERLVVHDKLAQLLQQVIAGSDTSINPEPLKAVMGRRNPRFASHFQQDAHEFLLHLVTEYEKELVQAVDGVVKAEVDEESSKQAVQPQEAAEDKPAQKKSSLLNFFRLEKKEEVNDSESTTNTAPPATATASVTPTPDTTTRKLMDDDALVAELYPAECFRTELYRTLTCCSCKYSRRQVEKFYDFSLDLPYVPLPLPTPIAPEAQPHPPQTSSGAKQCHCGVDALIIGSGDDRLYCCAKSTCSLRENMETQEMAESVSSPAKTTSADPLPSPPVSSPALALGHSIHLADLLQEQFKSEVLELTCEKCKEGREAMARYEVKSLPRVLVLHLKRFEVNPQTGSLYKRCDLVEAPAQLFPVQKIHGSDEIASDLADKRYMIKSVVHHLGKTIDEGHYVADVCGQRGAWRRRNDTHETLIGEDFALRASRSQESCYMMFYVATEPADAQEQDKENAVDPTQPPVGTRTTTPTHPDSPASLVGRRRELTPPRRNESKVSKSLHELL